MSHALDLIDMIYARMEVLQGKIQRLHSHKPEEARGLLAVLDEIEQIYDLLYKLRSKMSECHDQA